MSALIAALLVAIPHVLLAIFAKLVTESFLQTILTKLIVKGLEKLVPMTSNTIDDEIVAEVKKRLES